MIAFPGRDTSSSFRPHCSTLPLACQSPVSSPSGGSAFTLYCSLRAPPSAPVPIPEPPDMSRYRPSPEEFRELARQYSLVPVYRQLVGDTDTPVTAFCKIQEGDWSFLFESVIGGERLGRYSF